MFCDFGSSERFGYENIFSPPQPPLFPTPHAHTQKKHEKHVNLIFLNDFNQYYAISH